MACRLTVSRETWPLRGAFTISRGSRTTAEVVVAEITDGEFHGRGECVPYARYGETVAAVAAAITELAGAVAEGLTRQDVQRVLRPGAARNALDCAFWDLEAKRAGQRAWQLVGLPPPQPMTTAYTLSLDTPEAMAAAARAARDRPILKVKLGGAGDLERVRAVRSGAPSAALIVDANEAWTPALYDELVPQLHGLGVQLIEQPLPAQADGALAGRPRPVPVCADESCHDRGSLAGLAERYDVVNVKLDKTGGLTEALALVQTAAAAGLGIMVGCMIGTSLAMAPAILLGATARFVDLDGPLLLAGDRAAGLSYANGRVHPPDAALWG
ncbi:MAG: dipeptide epimerase [Alphaproteobacteria bacterium]|nr:dipeptide epimerase [Alphaproteobacteria bacterium]